MSDEQQIPGVPAGWRLVRIGMPNRGDTVIDGGGTAYTFTAGGGISVFPIIERIEPEPQTRTVVVREWVCTSSIGEVWLRWCNDPPTSTAIPTGRTREVEVPA